MLNKDYLVIFAKKLNFFPDIDYFANRLNHQVPKYISYRPDPEASYGDCFANLSICKRPHLFPPFSLVGRVLGKIRIVKIMALIVVLDWLSQVYYPTLKSMMVSKPMRIAAGQTVLVLPEKTIRPVNQEMDFVLQNKFN